jgi:ribosomal protein L36
MAQADSQSTTHPALLGSSETHVATDAALSPSAGPGPATAVVSGPQATDPIFNAIKAHKRELDRRNQTIEVICAAEDRHKAEERDAWHRYEAASIALLTTKPTTMAGVIALLSYVALPECSGPGKSESILDGARLSSNQEAATAAERFPVLSAEALGGIAGEHSHG